MAYTEQTVTSKRAWSEHTFSFTTTKPKDFHFENGEFVTIGLRPEGKLIARAYSIVAGNDADYLEFLSIHVPDGPLTSRLVHIREGDGVWVNDRPTGTLTLRHVQPGRNLYLLSTGTGLAPFMCLVRSPQIVEAFERVVLIHTVRSARELAYRDELEALASDRFRYVPTVTREPFATPLRGSELFITGQLFTTLGLPAAEPEQDRVMICGNPAMNRDMSAYLQQHGWTITNHKGIGNFTVEKAFVVSKE
jgi:ferredoxin--NADP+ reductase